ncbi:MAG: acyltransferase [Candidatus Gracilibacteria bacterium]|nr:acyltransferase [Candidatus Gracilibacteria bacterium]
MSQARPLPGFNGLRALACLSVIIYHLNQHRSVTDLALWNWDLYQFVEMWPIAVSLFFILSAITSSLPFWRAILKDTPAPKTRELFIGRFFRIAPAYYAVLIFTFLLTIVLNGYSDGAFLRFMSGATFLAWTHPFTFFPVDINGPLWYISYDMMGAILVMGTMSILVRVRKIFIPLVFLAVGGLLFALHLWFMGLPFPKLDGIVSEWFPAYNPFIFGIHFLIGILVAGALVWQEKNHSSRSLWYDLLFVLITFVFFSFLWIIREASDFDYSWLHGAHRFPLATIALALLVFLAPSTEYIGKWLDNYIFRRIARLSYSVYLWHAIVIVLMTRFAFDGQHDLPMPEWLILAGVAFVGSFSLAWISYTYIEIPVSNWWRVRCERKKTESLR